MHFCQYTQQWPSPLGTWRVQIILTRLLSHHCLIARCQFIYHPQIKDVDWVWLAHNMSYKETIINDDCFQFWHFLTFEIVIEKGIGPKWAESIQYC